MNLKNKKLVVFAPWHWGDSGFELQVKELVKHFKSYEVIEVLSFDRKFVKNHIEMNSGSVFMVFTPGTGLRGLMVLQMLKNSIEPYYFARTTSNVAAEFKANHNFPLPFVNTITKSVMKGVINFNTGRIIFEDLPKQHEIVSSSFIRPKVVKTKKNFQEPLKILYVGLLEKKKGVEYLLRALSELKFGYHLDIIGRGCLRNKLGETAKKLCINCKFHGYLPFKKLAKFYKEADIVVIPSLEETQGKVWLEAMSYGTPVVATKIPAFEKYLADSWNCLLAKPKSSYWIAESIKILVQEPELRKEIIKNGYKTAKLNSIFAMNNTILKILNKELNEGGKNE